MGTALAIKSKPLLTSVIEGDVTGSIGPEAAMGSVFRGTNIN